MNDEPPPEVIEATPEHLRGGLRRCRRCARWFVPLGADRPACIACARAEAADLLMMRLAYGKTYEE